jgi:hypothetical protein
MAMSFQSPNYTQTPNDFFVMVSDMSEAELRVTLVMIRQTFGFHREEFKLGVTKLANAAGLSRQGALDGAAAAEKRGTFRRTNPDAITEAEWELVVDEPLQPVDPSSQLIPPLQSVEGTPQVSGGQVGVKESIKKELNKRGDLIDGYLDLAQSPGIKRMARIDAVLSYLSGRLKINTETKRWKDFARFVDERQQSHHEPLDIFISWLTGQKNFDVQFWPPSKMQEMWPQAFLLESQPNVPQINVAALEATKQLIEQKTGGEFTPRPDHVPAPVLIKQKLQEAAQQRRIRK